MRYVTRNLAAGIAAGALLIAAQSIAAAQDRGSVQGVGCLARWWHCGYHVLGYG